MVLLVESLRRLFLNIRYGRRIRISSDSSFSRSSVLLPRKGHITVGSKSIISHFCIIDTQNKEVEIGNSVSLQSGCVVYGNVTIGDNTRIATQVVIVASTHNYSKRNILIKDQGYSANGIVIGNDVWIGAGAKILDGSVIGDGCVIGANAVVKGCLEPYGVYVGAPAKKIKERI